MGARLLIALCILSLCMGLVSCQKLEEVRQTKQKLEKVPLEFLDAIPIEYGRLVGVTSNSQYPNWAQLWFEKEDKTIAVVLVNFVDGNFMSHVLLIPRK